MSLENILEAKMKLKILNYNIHYGFHTHSEKPKFEPEKQEAAQRVVDEYDPDVLVLNEANFLLGNKWGIKMDYREIFGMDKFPYIARTDHPKYKEWSTAVLSKYPFTHKDKTNRNGRGMKTQIDLGNGKTVNLDTVHPNPMGRQKYFLTAEENAEFLSGIISGQNSPHILVGDFNGISPQDEYDMDKLLAGYRTFCKTEDDAKWLLEQQMSFAPLKTVLDNGLVDTYKRVHPEGFDYTIPTKIGGSIDSASRIDYIIVSPDIGIVNAGIIKNEYSDIASDHYPVYAELSI